MFSTYRFDHLERDRSREITAWSYLWASLAGPAYVLAHGFLAEAVAMLVLTVVIAAGAVVALAAAVGLFDSPMTNVLSSFAIPLAALVLQGWVSIRVVRFSYARRGWREGS
ncbi:MAG: hypothetical protein ACOY4R_10695 [Pseudomonadota bacterium]